MIKNLFKKTSNLQNKEYRYNQKRAVLYIKIVVFKYSTDKIQ
jgi:hypothetical protein